MTQLKKENSECFYIESKSKCDWKWSLIVIKTIYFDVYNPMEENYLIIFIAIFFLK